MIAPRIRAVVRNVIPETGYLAFRPTPAIYELCGLGQFDICSVLQVLTANKQCILHSKL